VLRTAPSVVCPVPEIGNKDHRVGQGGGSIVRSKISVSVVVPCTSLPETIYSILVFPMKRTAAIGL